MNESESVSKEFLILDHVPLGICLLKDDFTVLFWNSFLENWTGILRTELIGTKITARFQHLNDTKYISRFTDIFNGGPPTIFSSQLHQYIIPAPLDSSNFRIQHTTVTAVRSPDPKKFYALLAIQDVTDLTHRIQGYRAMRDQALAEVSVRKLAEERLQKAHEHLELRVKERTADLVSVNEKLQQEITVRKKTEAELKKLLSTLDTLVNHMPEGVALCDSENLIILANSLGENYLNKLAGVTVGDRLTHIAGIPLQRYIVSEPHDIWHEIEFDGSLQSIYKLAGKPVGEDTAITGTVLVIKDVTEEKVVEERLNSQGRLAAVGQLAAGIAHDFNNILTGIIGFADILMKDSTLNRDDFQMVEAILKNGQRAAQLIRQILDFSRKSLSEMTSFDLRNFLDEFSKFIRRTIPENIDIVIKCSPGDYFVSADPTKMQQVLTNLAVNSRDAMPNGGKLIFGLSNLSVRHGEKRPIPDLSDGNWVTLSVSDSGTGISSDVLPHIFEPFFTTKDVNRGTGLGLSQVYGIIKQHEGHIDLETSAGKGCKFKIYLPASSAGEPAAVSSAEISLPAGQDRTVLVVEDNELVRNLIERRLSKLNYTVLAARNGKEALSFFNSRADEITLVITDLVMPEMGGIELSKILKSRKPDIKVIALSGYPLGSEKQDLLDAGITECIQKPFQGQTLIEVLCRTIDNQNSQSSTNAL